MPLLNRKRLIMAKLETTYGVDPIPSATTDALLVRDNISITPLEADYVERNLVRPYFGLSERLPTNIRVQLDVEVEAAGFVTAGTPNPAISAMMRACALSETLIPAPPVVSYSPISDGIESATLYFSLDGVLHKIVGARGTVSINFQSGEFPTFNFSFTGIFQPVIDTPAGTPDFTNFQTPQVADSGTTIDLHSVAGNVVESVTIDVANQTTFRSLIGGADEVLITDRQPTGSITLEAVTIAAKDWYRAVHDGDLGNIDIVHGPIGNRVRVTGQQLQLTEPSMGDSDGVAMLSMNMQLLPNTGNDEFVIDFL